VKVCIVVYSCTGNTLSVARRLSQSLRVQRIPNETFLVPLCKANPEARLRLDYTSLSQIPPSEILIFASCVQYFHLPPLMKKYIKTLSSLKKRQVHCVITQGYKASYLGARQALRTFKKLIKKKEASFCGAHIIHWSSLDRENQINDVLSTLGEKIIGSNKP